MTRYLTSLLGLLFVGALLWTPQVHAQSADERIDRFDVAIALKSDATFDVVETIHYNFGAAQHHGIFRDIPVVYSTQAGNKSIGVGSVSVQDEKGKPYPFTTSRIGPNEEIKIGDPNVLVSGSQTYVLHYTVARAIGYFPQYDEIYWNVTGNGWKVPITEASATVLLPRSTDPSQLKLSCYQGAAGSNETCTSKANGSGENVFAITRELRAGEGLTIALGFPLGIVHHPTFLENLLAFIKDNFVLFVPILVFVGMLYLWYTKGRDPRGRGTIIPEYEAPDHLTPVEMLALLKTGATNEAVSAEIVYLATQGYLHIKRTEQKILGIFNSNEYTLTKQKDGGDLGVFDKTLFNGLFKEGNEVKVSDLKEKFYLTATQVKTEVLQSLVQKKYYVRDPNATRMRYVTVGVIILFGSIWGGSVLGLAAGVSGIMSGLLILAFGFFMPAVTKEGALAREYSRGLKLYLEVAEKDRINFHNAPEKSPELFEKLLPYAMVLGVEVAWAGQFEGMYTQPPSWYSDQSLTGFNSIVFAHSMHSFNSVAATTLASAPGGGSGSGGGGFSGGGMGGGGGGSW